jgi:hypothetical protein
MFASQQDAINEAWRIRRVCERIYADDTRAPRRASLPPSTGHCAVVALLVRELMGANVRAITHPGSGAHWFGLVRGTVNDRAWGLFVDLTLDQFLLPDRLMVGEADPWPNLAHRDPGEPKSGLLSRFERFRSRYFAALP